MKKLSHHWGVCNTFELEVEIKGIHKKMLKKMLQILKKNKLFGPNAEYFWPDALNDKQEQEWQLKFGALKDKLMKKAKSDGQADIFTTMAKKGFVPGGLVIAPDLLGAEGSKVLDAYTSGKESAAEVMQDSALIAFVNKTTGEVKFAGQSGLDIKSGSEYAKDADKKIIKPMLKKAMAATAIEQIAQSKGQTGLDYKIQYNEETGQIHAEADITNQAFSDHLLPTYNEENGIQTKKI